MTDIFLSYTEKDREQARRVAAMLESVGWTVWWDRRIPAGETWRTVLEKALENMRCMIVLWSARSIESEWVYEEATEGRRQGKLVPVLIEAVRPPAGFREIQAADLTDWDGTREFEGLRMLLADLENMLGKPSAAPGNRRPGIDGGGGSPDLPYDPADLAGGVIVTPWWQKPRLAAMAAAGTLLVAGAIYLAWPAREPTLVAPPVRDPERHENHPGTLPGAATLAPTTHETESAPVAKVTPQARTPAKRSETTRTASARCTDLLARIQLGESLSYEAQAVFQKECQQ